MPRDSTQYDDRAELATYLWDNYPNLFSQDEKRASSTLLCELKAAHIDSEEIRSLLIRRGSARGNPVVDQLLADGPDAFRTRAAERVFSEHWARIDINRCGKCSRIVATPKARQCLWCGHDWHS
jgi:hypothetical protein